MTTSGEALDWAFSVMTSLHSRMQWPIASFVYACTSPGLVLVRYRRGTCCTKRGMSIIGTRKGGAEEAIKAVEGKAGGFRRGDGGTHWLVLR